MNSLKFLNKHSVNFPVELNNVDTIEQIESISPMRYLLIPQRALTSIPLHEPAVLMEEALTLLTLVNNFYLLQAPSISKPLIGNTKLKLLGTLFKIFRDFISKCVLQFKLFIVV